MRRLCVLSMHTSPLAQPGSADAGGMNVYVRELATSLVQAGVAVRVYTRATHGVPAGPQTVAPALIYADLLATGNVRCCAAAQAIYESFLARAFPSR